ncbi:shikimate dehydrogenase [Methylomonas lenta]|uniref:Shikimate dehydrogenase (NADP(+)) n=1 Tax=Methylomonas lenta TaxID=980561 RepID=A0A177N0Z5_9GAMM|nr:shikimate dehydrogenase [Methylomonas lenta]OAI11213.1 shikimate dehydrogenase [Methylomonas lenta]
MIDSYAVFGHPINHSKSPRIHRLFAEQTRQDLTYTAQDVPSKNFKTSADNFFSHGGNGLNCTVPLKELAWSYADHLSDRARLSKAVNTLARQPDGRILGDNTDGIGLVNDLTLNHAITLSNQRILILGAGGATRGILAPILAQQPSQIVIANRTRSKADTLATEFAQLGNLRSSDFANLAQMQFDLIINATSASLSNQLPPLPANLLSADACCYDLAYANEPTAFVRWGISQHARFSLDGLGMLVEQAAAAFKLWRGIQPATSPVIALLNSERHLPPSSA